MNWRGRGRARLGSTRTVSYGRAAVQRDGNEVVSFPAERAGGEAPLPPP